MLRFQSLMFWGQLFFIIVFSARASAQLYEKQLAKATTSGHKEDVVELAQEICQLHKQGFDLKGSKSVAAIQLLASKLDTVADYEKPRLLLAIQHLIPSSAAAAYLEVEKGHTEKSVSDSDWVDSLRCAAVMVPDQVESSLLKSLEEWSERFPFQVVKMPKKEMFDSSMLKSRGPKFLVRAIGSKNPKIASAAFIYWCDEQRELLKSMHEQWPRVLDSWNPEHRLEAIDFYSKLNPTWDGQQSRLLRLTNDRENRIANKAIGIWTHGTNLARSQLETLVTGTAARRVRILETIDADAVTGWGSMNPIIELFKSPDIETRKTAAKAFGRLSTQTIEPALKAFNAEGESVVRQAFLDETQFRGWSVPGWGENRQDWKVLNSASDYYPLLAKAERDGLNTEKAMQRLTKPYGYRPNQIYRKLSIESLSRFETMSDLSALLESDPSDEATQTAIRVIGQLLAGNKLGGHRGELELFSKHAHRLSPIVPELAAYIEATKQMKLVPVLAAFGNQAEPALPLMIRILEDDSREWHDFRGAAIRTIRAFGPRGKPAANALLKVIAEKDYSNYVSAALTYLDIGCDPAPLFPTIGGCLPVLAKIDPEKLVAIPGFQEYIRSAIVNDRPYDVLHWLGPHAEFLLPELKDKFKTLFPTPTYLTGEFDQLVEVIAQLGPCRQEFVPLCLEYLKQEPSVPHVCEAALKTLNQIGDDQRLAYETIKSLMQSPNKFVESAAQHSFQSLYCE